MSHTVTPSLRDLTQDDLERVIEIDTQLTGAAKRGYWSEVLGSLALHRDHRRALSVAAEIDGRLIGYLLGEVRAFEFGAQACGWILVIGVDPAHARGRVATALLGLARRRFREAGVDTVRTMVGRTDVPLLSFFRASGFAGGAFVQLELGLEGER